MRALASLLCLTCMACASSAVPVYEGANKAQTQEDIFLYETYFYGKSGGTILESGALDGLRFSTSYLFEKLFEWKAIHIEGDVKNYKQLQINRPQSTNLNIALCDENRTLHYLEHRGGAVSGIKEFMDQQFLQWRYSRREAFNITEVQCLTMRDAMRQLGVSHVDIWVLDLEGGELPALRGVDFHAFQADVILMETTSNLAHQTLHHLHQQNYTCCLVPGAVLHVENHACVRRGFVPSTAPHLILTRMPHHHHHSSDPELMTARRPFCSSKKPAVTTAASGVRVPATIVGRSSNTTFLRGRQQP